MSKKEKIIKHVCKPEDNLQKIAHQYGFTSWKDIYYDKVNDEYRKGSPSPWVLRTGEKISIPFHKNNLRVKRGSHQTFTIKKQPKLFKPLLNLQIDKRSERSLEVEFGDAIHPVKLLPKTSNLYHLNHGTSFSNKINVNDGTQAIFKLNDASVLPISSHGVQSYTFGKLGDQFFQKCESLSFDPSYPEKLDDQSLYIYQINKDLHIMPPDGWHNTDTLSQEQAISLVQQLFSFVWDSSKETALFIGDVFEPTGSNSIPLAHDLASNAQNILKYSGTKFYIKTHPSTGNKMIILKGYSGTRKYYKSPIYGVTNPVVTHMYLGKETWKGALKSGLKSNGFTFIFVGGIDFLEYLADDKQNFGDLLVQLGITISEMAIAALTGLIAGMAITAGLILLGITAPVWAVYAAGVVAGVAMGGLLTYVDTRTRYAYSEKLKSKGHSFWEESVSKPFFETLKTINNSLDLKTILYNFAPQADVDDYLSRE